MQQILFNKTINEHIEKLLEKEHRKHSSLLNTARNSLKYNKKWIHTENYWKKEHKKHNSNIAAAIVSKSRKLLGEE